MGRVTNGGSAICRMCRAKALVLPGTGDTTLWIPVKRYSRGMFGCSVTRPWEVIGGPGMIIMNLAVLVASWWLMPSLRQRDKSDRPPDLLTRDRSMHWAGTSLTGG